MSAAFAGINSVSRLDATMHEPQGGNFSSWLPPRVPVVLPVNGFPEPRDKRQKPVCEQMIGASLAHKIVTDQIQLVGPTDATVLIDLGRPERVKKLSRKRFTARVRGAINR